MESSEITAVRRRRRLGRPVREQTPEPNLVANGRRSLPPTDDSSQLEGTSACDEGQAQTVRMQIRPPGSISAHESKILRRRDKTFASAAARSHSQPRQAERLSSPEANDLLRIAKRSLSSPRHKDESSESELTAASAPPLRSSGGTPLAAIRGGEQHGDRLAQNLRRFEDERKRFEAEKRNFEREKREHRMRYKQMHDQEELRRIVQNYRKLSDSLQLPANDDERRRLVHSLRLQRSEAPVVRPRKRSTAYDESSTQFSSSDADVEDAAAQRLAKTLSPTRRHASTAGSFADRSSGPPQAPSRQPASRNNSLSPIRPERRSKTPEVRAELRHKSNEGNQAAQLPSPVRHENRIDTTTTEADSEMDGLRRRRSLPQPEPRRKQSLERPAKAPPPQYKEVEFVAPPEPVPPITPIFVRKLQSYLETLFTPKPKPVPQVVDTVKVTGPPTPPAEAMSILSRAFLKQFYLEARYQWRSLKSSYPEEVTALRQMRNKCVSHIVILIMLCGFGGLLFRYTEGSSENIYKCEVRKVKRDFIDNLWTVSHNMREDDWKSLARQKLRKFEEELHTIQELGVRYFPGQKSWNFVNCILYCWTVITTIGYGHITPKTTLGQSLTIIYAIIGIPMFLILLADFGKLFTRCMKFLWAYVRRLYYTGTCRSIRKQQQVRDAMTGFNNIYDIAIRRPSQFFNMGPDADIESQISEAGKSVPPSHPETPTSPYPETFEIDDEFNLPVSLASILLISYILIGAFVYTLWEDWTYFEAFYFVFVSMSTIGFGDFVPNHPIFMMCSIIYLVFGLALTSMFINVVQIKLSDTFKQASVKIGATMGFGLPSEAGDETGSQLKTPSDLASVHGSRLGKIAEDDNEVATATSQSPQLTSILRTPRPISPSTNTNGSYNDNVSEYELGPPPLLPRRQVSMEQQQQEAEPKKKKRFFK